MTKFLKRIILFFIILLLLVNVIQTIPPYYWANPAFAAKIKYLEENQEEYDTYFFGSSHIYRQISPVVFDNFSNLSIKSYNLGAPATFVPETYYLLENFLKQSDSVNNKYIFVELQGISYVAEENFQTNREKYSLTFKEYLFSMRALLDNKY